MIKRERNFTILVLFQSSDTVLRELYSSKGSRIYYYIVLCDTNYSPVHFQVSQLLPHQIRQLQIAANISFMHNAICKKIYGHYSM